MTVSSSSETTNNNNKLGAREYLFFVKEGISSENSKMSHKKIMQKFILNFLEHLKKESHLEKNYRRPQKKKAVALKGRGCAEARVAQSDARTTKNNLATTQQRREEAFDREMGYFFVF